MVHQSLLLSLTAALLAGSLAGDGWAAEPADPDEARLHSALLPTESQSLVHFLELRERGEPVRMTFDQLIENLGAPGVDARQQACAELVAIGTPALPRLRALVREGGRPATLARHCVTAIESDGGVLTSAAARLLARRRGRDGSRVLLDYLPHAENDSVLQDIQESLRSLAHEENGTVDPTVVNALSDEHPLRRATAVILLADGDLTRHRDAVRKLLSDPAASVRLRAALALAKADDPQAVATLITLLGEVADHETQATIQELLTDLAGPLGPITKSDKEEQAPAKASETWLRWWRDTDGPSLLNELKKRTRPEVDLGKAQALVRKLGDNAYDVREAAQTDLVRLGVPILALLRQVYRNPPDLEVQMRVRECIEKIEKENEKAKEEYLPRLMAVARLIAIRKPPGAAEAILAYLPSQDEEGLREELENALAAAGFSNGKADPVLLKGLADKSATRRIAAARALCAVPKPDQVEKARPLLEDADPAVRLAVAQALGESRDPAALVALASFVAHAPADLAAQAEDFLSKLASEAGPKDLPEGDENREKRSKAWVAWARTAANTRAVFGTGATTPRDRVRLASGGRVRGYTLLVRPQSNTVTALGPDGKERWALTGLQGPLDAQVLPNQHVLVAEMNRVTERDLRGTILWKFEGITPVSVQRLPNGNTFVPCEDRLIEVTRGGKEVFRAMVGGIAAARRLPDGRIVVFGQQNEVIQLDKAGTEVKRVPVMCGGAGCNEVLDNGHVLALSPGMGNLIEFDQDGNEVGRFEQQGAANAFRLPNGHTLVMVRGTKFVELDKNWQQVKETALSGDVFRVKAW